MPQKAEPGPEEDDPPVENKGKGSDRVDPGPYDDDPPPEKRSTVSSLLRSWWNVLVRFLRRI